VKNLQFLALGGLLHDLGHFLGPGDLREHPQLAAARVKDLKHMDLHVTQIIAEHEECIDGSGYPAKMTEPLMNPLSVFVSTANLFDRLVTFEKLKRPDAVKKMFTDYLGRYPLDHVNALKALVSSGN
jgi:HD-GYP domain-containing protein (c-di-GMP phosphodiesterase class II)